MKHFVGKVITQTTPFMGGEVEVRKLTVGQIMSMQDIINKAAKVKGTEGQIKLLRDIIRISVVGADELTDEDFNTFPIQELNQLSEAILSISGLGGSGGESGN
jgi:hypothetical protein